MSFYVFKKCAYLRQKRSEVRLTQFPKGDATIRLWGGTDGVYEDTLEGHKQVQSLLFLRFSNLS